MSIPSPVTAIRQPALVADSDVRDAGKQRQGAARDNPGGCVHVRKDRSKVVASGPGPTRMGERRRPAAHLSPVGASMQHPSSSMTANLDSGRF